MSGKSASKYHEEPEVVVVHTSVLQTLSPRSKQPHHRVDKDFWTRVIRHLLLLKDNECLKITFQSRLTNSTNTGCYLAADRQGIKVSVRREANVAYVRRVLE